MKETIRCPICNRRVFDLSWEGRMEVEIKCKRCKKIFAIRRPDTGTARDGPIQDGPSFK